jgi:hypothetical protein
MTMGSEPVGDIAAEAEEARLRIASTIDDIQDRLDPRRMMSEAVERVTGSSRQLISDAGNAARAHPLAIGAGVVAIGIALLARNKLSKATVNLGDDLGEYTDYDDGFGFAEQRPARLYADEGDGDDDGEGPPAARPKLTARASGTVESNPIVSIILGLAAGAALGALFPSTEAERKALGETGGKLSSAARAAVRRAADELDSHGLSVDSVRARASDATRKAKRAAQSVMDAARDELKG